MSKKENGLKRGYIQVYTGNGKGKTTAALGLALRAVGRGLRVHMIQFMKRWGVGEHLAAKQLGSDLQIEQVGQPYLCARGGDLDKKTRESLPDDVVVFTPDNPPQKMLESAQRGLEKAHNIMQNCSADILILDEINVAADYEFISQSELLKLMDSKPAGMELILTGRNAKPDIIEKADLVTEMQEIKHYYQQGVTARNGIEK